MSQAFIELDKVTTRQFIAFCELLDEMQPEYDKRFPDKERLTSIKVLTEYPEYVEAIVKFWTGWDSVKDKDANLVLGVFTAIQELSLMPEPVPLKGFEHEGEWYYAPDDVQLMKRTAPMGKASFGQVLEALQMEQLIEGKYGMIPYVLATIFLKPGEVLDDVDVNQRAELFQSLPITKALNAYFFLAHFANTSIQRINRYLKEEVMAKQPKPA